MKQMVEPESSKSEVKEESTEKKRKFLEVSCRPDVVNAAVFKNREAVLACNTVSSYSSEVRLYVELLISR